MAKWLKVADSAARTTNFTSPILENYGYNDTLHLVVDISSGSPNLVVTVSGYDNVSAKAYTLLTSSTLNTSGTTVLRVGPDYTAGTNTAKDVIPAYWRVSVTQSGGVSATYSIGASLI